MKFPSLILGLITAGLLTAPARNLSAQTPTPGQHTFAIGDTDFLIDGKPIVIRCGEIHFPRVPPEYWRHRLQMAKAMGLNTVCVYLFGNFHECEEGKFTWTGAADTAEFCRLAQQEGLWVILRPGPYSCPEWEMGGLPWWLLKNDAMKLRTKAPSFLVPATRYLKEVARVLAPLQVTRGGTTWGLWSGADRPFSPETTSYDYTAPRPRQPARPAQDETWHTAYSREKPG